MMNEKFDNMSLSTQLAKLFLIVTDPLDKYYICGYGWDLPQGGAKPGASLK
jgi:hypothetical protein